MRILPLWKAGCILIAPLGLWGQDAGAGNAPAAPPAQAVADQRSNGDNKAQIREIHSIEKARAGGMSQLAAFSKDPDRRVRIEAVKAIVKLGGYLSLSPLIAATQDPDVEVRVRATDGIVNYYLPGYVGGYFTHSAREVRSWFSARNDSVVDPDVHIRDDAGGAIVAGIAFGDDMPARANAARAAGVMRLHAAVPALEEALRSKNNDLIFESLVALTKIHDPSAGPSAAFLLRDPDERIQATALETEAALGNRAAAPDVRYVFQNARGVKVQRAALAALAMFGLPEDRPLFRQYAASADAELRASAVEGLGRIREPEDTAVLQSNYDEADLDWRIHLAAAFGLVNEGNAATDEFSPLRFLIESLNAGPRQGTANAYLVELLNRESARKAMPPLVADASSSEKIALSWIFAANGNADLLPALDPLEKDPDGEVATAAKRAAHVIQQQQQARPAP